jgi:2-polyprenyl-6-methoxyphenol hydroxylase-like FAD-dependent oxidoreductase
MYIHDWMEYMQKQVDVAAVVTAPNKNVLVSGASFAGLATAYWMNKLGYQVTVVEVAKDLKKGGTPVNVGDDVADIVKRMGLFEQIQAARLKMEGAERKNAHDVTEGPLQLSLGTAPSEVDWEIERDTLLDLMFGVVKDDVEFVFKNSIEALDATENDVRVSFEDGSQRSFALIFGCDGIHSRVRKLQFGDEAEYTHFLGQYFSITIVNELLIKENTTQVYNEAGRFVMLNAYNNKTDIVLKRDFIRLSGRSAAAKNYFRTIRRPRLEDPGTAGKSSEFDVVLLRQDLPDKNAIMDKWQSGPGRRRRLLRLSGRGHGRVVGDHRRPRAGGCVSETPRERRTGIPGLQRKLPSLYRKGASRRCKQFERAQSETRRRLRKRNADPEP